MIQINKIYKQSEEHRRKISESNKGLHRSIEARNNISKSHLGRIVSEQTREKISKTMKEKGISGITKFKKGYKQTEKSKQKIREAKLINNPGCLKKGNMFVYLKKNFKHNEQTKLKISKTRKERMENGQIKLSPDAGWNKENRKNFILPLKDTKIEVKIQNFLKELNINFLTHQYIKDIEHGYQCDILIPLMKMVIECDGDYWHKYPIGNEIDHIRTSELLQKGFKVLRLWEFEIRKMNLNEFKEKLI